MLIYHEVYSIVRSIRDTVTLVVVVIALVAGVALLPNSAFNWRVFAQVYGTPTPQPGQSVVVTTNSAPIVLDANAGGNDVTPPTGELLNNERIVITPENPDGRPVEISALALYSMFSNNAGFQALDDVKVVPPAERLLLQSGFMELRDPTLIIQVYVLSGNTDGSARFQINIYRDGVLIDDKTEFEVTANGTVTWFRRG